MTDITCMTTSVYNLLDSFQSQDLGETPGHAMDVLGKISARTESLAGSNIEQIYFENYFIFYSNFECL